MLLWYRTMVWWSDSLGTVVDHQLINLKQVAGFFDGDGSVFITGQGQMGCAVTQCSYQTIQKLQQTFGGTIRKRDPKTEPRRNGAKQRIQYTLVFRGVQILGILPFIQEYLILKSRKADILLEMMTLYNRCDSDAKFLRQKLINKFKDCSNDDLSYHDYSRLSWDYICGLFQAEGCLREDKFSITQKGCPAFLVQVKSFIDESFGASIGKVDSERFITSRKSEILQLITKLKSLGMFHDEKLNQLDAYFEKDYNEVGRLKHIDDDTPQEIIDRGNEQSKLLAHNIRILWNPRQ